MARSTNVYVVQPKGRMVPIAAFTVKREMKAWLAHRAPEYLIWRIEDGARVDAPKITEITREIYADV